MIPKIHTDYSKAAKTPSISKMGCTSTKIMNGLKEVMEHVMFVLFK